MNTSVYTLNTDVKGEEEHRLDKQHRSLLAVTKTLLPSHVHSYLLSRQYAPAVVDIGAGTGIWLRDLAAELPAQARLDGYDVDISKFPSDSALPQNVTLSYGDATRPFPDQLHGQYDCVHARLLLYALKSEQWCEVAANLKMLLRPAGWLVWDEVGYPGYTCLPITESYQKWINIDVRYAESIGRDITAPVRLLDQIKSQGYINCTEQVISTLSASKEVQMLTGEALIAVARRSMHGIVDRGGFDWLMTHDECEEIATKLLNDHTSGLCVIGNRIHWFTGQNPE